MLLPSIAPKVILFSDPYKFISTNAYAYATQLPHLQLPPVKTIVYPLSLQLNFTQDLRFLIESNKCILVHLALLQNS